MHLYTVLLLCPLSHCVTLKYNPPDIISKSKVELSPMLITCGLNDIVIIAAPVVDAKCLYHLYKPNGDFIKLNLPRKQHVNRTENSDYDNMVVKYINPNTKTMYPIRNSKVIMTGYVSDRKDVVRDVELSMFGNEFMIGPILEEDHGNWMLSVFFKDADDQWLELYQVITLEVVERVPLVREQARLKPGSNLRLKFAYPIAHLKTCELTAPSSSYDRFFDRSKINLDRCGYFVPNVTKQDEGVWRIIGVGNMIYEGYFRLHIADYSYTRKTPLLKRYKEYY